VKARRSNQLKRCCVDRLSPQPKSDKWVPVRTSPVTRLTSQCRDYCPAETISRRSSVTIALGCTAVRVHSHESATRRTFQGHRRLRKSRAQLFRFRVFPKSILYCSAGNLKSNFRSNQMGTWLMTSSRHLLQFLRCSHCHFRERSSDTVVPRNGRHKNVIVIVTNRGKTAA
jgi:hypothetical protein